MIFGKWDERSAYSRQAVAVPVAPAAVAVPVVAVPPSAAVVPGPVVEKPGPQ
jgi:hypothetical protein